MCSSAHLPGGGWFLSILAIGWAPPLVPDMVNYFSKTPYSDENLAFVWGYMMLITSICTIAAITLAVLNIAFSDNVSGVK